MDAPHTIGYNWSSNTISALFQPTAISGAANPARYVAVPAVLLYCISMGFVFKRISRKAATNKHQKVIEIGGVGSMVYAFLVVTPMHDLMVTIALLFFVVAVSGILHSLYTAKKFHLVVFGIFCLLPMFLNATLYYGNVLYGMIPVLQKIGFFAGATWFFVIYYSELERH